MTLLALLCAAMAQTPQSESYLDRTVQLMELSRAGLPGMAAPAEAAAKMLAEGGRLFASGDPGLVSEISGRAGGFMMIRPLSGSTLQANDVLLHFALPGVRETLPANPPKDAFAAVFGECAAGSGAACFPGHGAEAGVSPRLAAAADAWLFTGEMIAALTRLGKMPVIYESIGAYGGNARMVQYKNGEIGFHEDAKVPPVAAGAVGGRFVDEICRMLRRVAAEERDDLARTGAWARGAREQGGALFMYSMGHLFPFEVDDTAIGTLFKSAVWNAGFRHPHPEDAYGPKDVVVQIGYQQPPDVLLRKACPAGARVAYVSVRPDRDYMGGENVIWIDPMWDWPDACVPIDGYDVPLLAASGIVNGTIAWEIYRLSAQP